jgi:hypothetical protein
LEKPGTKLWTIQDCPRMEEEDDDDVWKVLMKDCSYHCLQKLQN